MLYYLCLGSNLGEREKTLRAALEHIEQQVGKVLRCSSFYYSEPWGFESENGFCNLCCAVESTLCPIDVLNRTQSIERQLGRTEKSENGHYSDRIIDIDIILVFDKNNHPLSINTSELTIPHPLWEQRDFVRIPLREILAERV